MAEQKQSGPTAKEERQREIDKDRVMHAVCASNFSLETEKRGREKHEHGSKASQNLSQSTPKKLARRATKMK